jgi:hypothetical protein
MKTTITGFIISLVLLGSGATTARAASDPFVHRLRVWGGLSTQIEKVDFVIAFTNGLFYGNPEETAHLRTCMNDNMTYEQAVAMIDKYYADHPERWNQPLAQEVVIALTVQGGPCPFTKAQDK